MGYICRRHRVRPRPAREQLPGRAISGRSRPAVHAALAAERERKARPRHDDSNGFAEDEGKAPSWIS